jgi:hypothetical protein
VDGTVEDDEPGLLVKEWSESCVRQFFQRSTSRIEFPGRCCKASNRTHFCSRLNIHSDRALLPKRHGVIEMVLSVLSNPGRVTPTAAVASSRTGMVPTISDFSLKRPVRPLGPAAGPICPTITPAPITTSLTQLTYTADTTHHHRHCERTSATRFAV